MSLNEILLTAAAVFPAVALCIYIYKKDRAEKEPVVLLLLLLVLGGLSCYPAAKIEGVMLGWIREIFEPYATYANGVTYYPKTAFYLHHACKYFFVVALVEEGIKFLVVLLVTRNNKNFNSLFDGLVYTVFVSLGFAGVENVMYVLRYGWVNAYVRAVLSVPAHMFFAVFMGYYYSLWHIYEKAGQQERKLKKAGLISKSAEEFSGKKYILPCLVVPIFVHGLYDFCCTLDSTWATCIFYMLMLLLYAHCFGKISKMSERDAHDEILSNRLVLKKYQDLRVKILDELTHQTIGTEDVQNDH